MMKKQLLFLLLLTGIASIHASQTPPENICKDFMHAYTEAVATSQKSGEQVYIPVNINHKYLDACIEVVNKQLRLQPGNYKTYVAVERVPAKGNQRVSIIINPTENQQTPDA